jgi:betaine-homocysteine S-methyltransferase
MRDTAAVDDAPGLLDRLNAGTVICAEGYLFELERRGYLQAGAYVPEVVLEHPDLVAGLHREFVHAGSDVVQAFTYYGHREKLRLIGKEELLEPLNRDALAIAALIARESGTLAAGNICNTNIYAEDAASRRAVRAIFDEQLAWIVEAGMDFVIGETFSFEAEAQIALAAIRDAGLASVITLAVHRAPQTRDGHTPAQACARLAAAGADVVGLNCIRGPHTMLPLIREIRAAVDCHVAALPVPYRTTDAEPSFQSLTDPGCDCIPGGRPFPTALDPFLCNRYEIAEFARGAAALEVRYMGVCCGAGPHMVRSMAEALGRRPPASAYSPDMSRHAFLGNDPTLRAANQAWAAEL